MQNIIHNDKSDWFLPAVTGREGRLKAADLAEALEVDQTMVKLNIV